MVKKRPGQLRETVSRGKRLIGTDVEKDPGFKVYVARRNLCHKPTWADTGSMTLDKLFLYSSYETCIRNKRTEQKEHDLGDK